MVVIETASGSHRLDVVELTGSSSRLPWIGARVPRSRLVVAPAIAGEAAGRLVDGGVNYVDLTGNCHLALGRDVYIHVEGKRPLRAAPPDRGIRAAGFQVLFTYLSGPYLALPVRAVGQLAGVSRQAVLEMRQRLLAEGYVVESAKGAALRWNPRRRDDALRRWFEGYRSTVRPRLLEGVYRTRSRDPDEIAAAIESTAGPPGDRWRWGGSAAAYQLRQHYRGERTVIHVRDRADEVARRLPALRDPEGNLIVLRTFGDINWRPQEPGATVDPLLAYSEMLVGDDERDREAAADLFDAVVRPSWTP